MSIRGKIPIYLSELIEKKVELKFSFHIGEPILSWRRGNYSGHHHFGSFRPQEHGANAIEIEHMLRDILSELPTDEVRSE